MISGFGSATRVPAGFVMATSDQEIAEFIGATSAPVCATGGDLSHVLGSYGSNPRVGDSCTSCDVDAIAVRAFYGNGETRSYVAVSTIAIGEWRHGIDFVTSSGFLSGLELCPRAHPGDGVLDILRIQPGLNWRARRSIKQRMLTGSHLPHPSLAVSRATSFERKGMGKLIVDGVPRGRPEEVSCHVLVGAVSMVVPHG